MEAEYQPGPNLSFKEVLQVYEDDQQITAEQIAQLVGESPTPEDLQAAKVLIEEDNLLPRNAYRRLARGLITPMAEQRDKNPMIAIDTANPAVFRLFHTAANLALHDYGGFGQIGYFEKQGYGAWELWRADKLASLFNAVDLVYAEMEKINKFDPIP